MLPTRDTGHHLPSTPHQYPHPRCKHEPGFKFLLTSGFSAPKSSPSPPLTYAHRPRPHPRPGCKRDSGGSRLHPRPWQARKLDSSLDLAPNARRRGSSTLSPSATFTYSPLAPFMRQREFSAPRPLVSLPRFPHPRPGLESETAQQPSGTGMYLLPSLPLYPDTIVSRRPRFSVKGNADI
jgi:hypothetical protein